MITEHTNRDREELALKAVEEVFTIAKYAEVLQIKNPNALKIGEIEEFTETMQGFENAHRDICETLLKVATTLNMNLTLADYKGLCEGIVCLLKETEDKSELHEKVILQIKTGGIV